VPLDRFGYSSENCSIARTLDIVGEKWTLLVLREAFYGVRRFDDFARALGCGRAILTARLNTLVTEGLLQRTPYREPGARTRDEYRLTRKGVELFPALLALLQWGDRWVADADGPAVEVTHRGCGEPVSLAMGCAAGHGALSVFDLEPRPGPGARRRSAPERGTAARGV
jgi:DNA-binding HxlR family transcriptional regulator